MRMLVIGTELKLKREKAKLRKLGYAVEETPGAMHHGRGVWTFPLEITKKET